MEEIDKEEDSLKHEELLEVFEDTYQRYTQLGENFQSIATMVSRIFKEKQKMEETTKEYLEQKDVLVQQFEGQKEELINLRHTIEIKELTNEKLEAQNERLTEKIAYMESEMEHLKQDLQNERNKSKVIEKKQGRLISEYLAKNYSDEDNFSEDIPPVKEQSTACRTNLKFPMDHHQSEDIRERKSFEVERVEREREKEVTISNKRTHKLAFGEEEEKGDKKKPMWMKQRPKFDQTTLQIPQTKSEGQKIGNSTNTIGQSITSPITNTRGCEDDLKEVPQKEEYKQEKAVHNIGSGTFGTLDLLVDMMDQKRSSQQKPDFLFPPESVRKQSNTNTETIIRTPPVKPKPNKYVKPGMSFLKAGNEGEMEKEPEVDGIRNIEERIERPSRGNMISKENMGDYMIELFTQNDSLGKGGSFFGLANTFSKKDNSKSESAQPKEELPNNPRNLINIVENPGKCGRKKKIKCRDCGKMYDKYGSDVEKRCIQCKKQRNKDPMVMTPIVCIL